MLFVCLDLLGQNGSLGQESPLPFRDVSGTVKGEQKNIAGVTVMLKSALDSLTTTTGSDGAFTFRQVRRASFNITVSGVDITPVTKRYLNSDLARQIVLAPFELKPQNPIVLKEVTINGKPTIIYKTDTVEHRAADYKIRDGDTLDELLRNIDGMQVGRDGSLTYQGQQVTKAKLNGKDFLGGNVAQTIKALPGEIIEKVQVIDDYGDQAAKTGVKNGQPSKTLNVTTKLDRSIGTYAQVSGQGGSRGRFGSTLTATRINANRQIAFIGGVSNAVTGIADGVAGGGGAGTTFSVYPSISYSDKWRNNIDVTASYNYLSSDNNVTNNSFGETYSSLGNVNDKNTSKFIRESTSDSKNQTHKFSGKLDYRLDKFNNLQISSNFNYSNRNLLSHSFANSINDFATGFEHSVMQSTGTSNVTASDFGVGTVYQHIFKKPRRNLSIQLGISGTNNTTNGEKYSEYRFYANSTENILLSDSAAHLLTRRKNSAIAFSNSIVYVEPLSNLSQLEFNVRSNRTSYDNIATSDTVLAGGQHRELARLSNIYDYTVGETRAALSYTYSGKKINVTVGGALLSVVLNGSRTNQNLSAALNSFRAIPVMRFTYIWSNTQRFNLTYAGNNVIPEFQQIQPFTDRTDPFYVVSGNPSLRPAFTSTLSASYNNYLAGPKLNISVGATATQHSNRISSNLLLRRELISANPDRYRTVYETTFVNVNGTHSLTVNHSVSKPLVEGRYNLSLNGSVTYGHNTAMSNNALYHTTSWRIYERLGSRITPNKNIEVNPSFAYDLSRTFASLAGSSPTFFQIVSLVVDGRMFLNSWRVTYSASKSFVTGLESLNRNPLVINTGLEKQLAKKNNLYLTFNVFDLLHQNNFIQQVVTPQGVTNTLSNTLSRYFMIGFRASFQKIGGKPQRNGQDMKRTGDGGFIN